MPRTLTATVYTYRELCPEAQAKVRDWFRTIESETFEPDVSYEDFLMCAACLGIEIDKRDTKLSGGRVRQDPAIYWSGFASQGDGARFEGTYGAKDIPLGETAESRIKAHAPKDETLHNIALTLDSLQATYKQRLVALVKHHDSHYEHSHTADITCWYDDPEDGSEPLEVTIEDEQCLKAALRRFMDWMYRQLEAEYEYRLSDEAVIESIELNDYEFTAKGERRILI